MALIQNTFISFLDSVERLKIVITLFVIYFQRTVYGRAKMRNRPRGKTPKSDHFITTNKDMRALNINYFISFFKKTLTFISVESTQNFSEFVKSR